MDFSFGISKKKYLVTGASSGIGQAAAILISKCGGKVVLNGRNEERLEQTRSQMEGEGHYIMPYDLTDLEGIKQYVKDCIDTDGRRFDGMVFSAGIVNPQPIRAERLENLRYMMTVNFFSYAALLKEFDSRRVLNDNGSIVAMSSCAARFPEKGQLSYASSKSAMDASSEVASHEFASRGVRVNTVRPDMTETPMTSKSLENPEIKKKYKEEYPLGILAPCDIAESIIFLLSDASRRITGQHILITSGRDRIWGKFSIS